VISKTSDPDANIIFGTTIDESMTDEIKLTVIATGFETPFGELNAYSNQTIRPQYIQQVPENISSNKYQRPSYEDDLGDTIVEPLNLQNKGNIMSQGTQAAKSGQASEPAVDEDKYKEKLMEEDEFDVPAFLRQKKN